MCRVNHVNINKVINLDSCNATFTHMKNNQLVRLLVLVQVLV